ncbi:MAG: ferrous iron efflux protein F [Methanomassiliicoccales archaeon PtaU1.Bin124]|nr:MAG: ferrous iron efflux protein F [Methanomassiliicoccales archaeon PtaU1.Bin124]
MDKKRVAEIVIVGGLIVFAIKLLAYIISDSIALLSDALESIINIIASIMMFISIRVASKPPDAEHQFGHKRAENVSCLIEGLLIIIAALLIMEAGLSRLFTPVELTQVDIALIVSLSATGINAGLSYFMLKESKKNESMALEGDSKHLLSDVLSSGGVVLGLFIATLTGWFVLDSILAIIMAVLIGKMGIDLMRKASTDLLDHSCPEVEVKVRELLDTQKGFVEYHELKTRKSGDTVFVMFHLCVDGKMTVNESHDLTERLERMLEEKIPGIDATIHVESEHQMCEGRTEEEDDQLNYRARSLHREHGPKE